MDSSSSSTDGLLKFLAWLDKNKQKVALIAAAAVVVVGLIVALIYYQSQKEERASKALSDVHTPFNPANPLPTGALQAYLKVAQDFEGTQAAGRALLEAAAILYTDGSFTNAETRYKQFLSEYAESPFLAQGMLGLASTLDAEGKTADAIAKYEELRRRFPSDSVADETKLALARLYEQTNPTEAFKLYNELVSLGSQSGVGSEAGIRRADLVERIPDLVKTNTPPPPTMTPTITPVPKASTLTAPSNNQVVMSISNIQKLPSTTITIPPSGSPATGAAPNAPLLLKPQPATNKTP